MLLLLLLLTIDVRKAKLYLHTLWASEGGHLSWVSSDE